MTPDRLTDERLAELERLCEASTPGPWRVRHLCSGCGPDDDEAAGLGLEIQGPPQPWHEGQFSRAADAQFIAAARDALRALIAEVRALREQNAAVHAWAAECEKAVEREQRHAREDAQDLIAEQDELHEESSALRRVAEAAAVVAVAIDHRLLKQQDLEQLEAALAEWRRVRGLPEREGLA